MPTQEPPPPFKIPDAVELFDFLLENVPDLIFFKDRYSRFICVNQSMLQHFGMKSREEIIGKTDFDILLPEDAQRTLKDEQAVLQTGKAIMGNVTRKVHPDGSTWWALTTKLPLRNAQGEIVGTCGISKDITTLKEAEDALERANAQLEHTLAERKLQERHLQQVTRLYAAMSQMNQTILRARTREDLFSGVCRTLVESAHFDMAWIGLVSPGDPYVNPAAKFGDAYDYLCRVRIFQDSRPEGCGPIGTAIREDSTQVVNDFQENPSTAPWHLEARKSGWHSCAAVPIRIAESAAGVLAVYSKVPGYFSEKEVVLLERASADISSALEMIDSLAALRR